MFSIRSCCGPRGGTTVRMEQKARSKFLPWPGLNLGPWHLAAADVTTRLPRTPPFSRLLRHAGGYSRTILTPNLQGLKYTLEEKEQSRSENSGYLGSMITTDAKC